MKGFEKCICSKAINKKVFLSSLKIIIPLYTTFVLFLISVFLIFVPMLEKQIINRKKEMIREFTKSTWSLISEYDQLVAALVLNNRK